MVQQNTDFGRVADDLRRAATSFALLTTQASLLGRSLQAFREFERQLVVTNAIAKGTVAQYNELSNAARSFALATTSSAVQAGAALQNLAQAGFTAEESLAGLGGVLLLAQATLTDVGVAADVLSSNIRAFSLDTTDAIRISNLFVAATDSSLATVDKLTFALRQVGPVAEVAGLSIEETTAFLGELFNIGLRGEQAGTSLRNIIVRLIRPTGEAAKILQEFGIATVDATGNFRGLEDVLRDLGNANLGEAQLAKIFENEALAGAIRAIKVVKDGVDGTASSYQTLLGQISGTNAALVRSLKTIDTLDGSLKLLQNSLTDAAITIGSELSPFVQELSLFVQDLVRAFNDLDDAQKANIAAWLGYSTAAVGVLATLSALSLIIRGLALSSIPALIGGITKLGGAFAALAGGATGAGAAIAAWFASFGAAGTVLALLGRFVLGVTAIGVAATAAYVAFRFFFGNARNEINSLSDLIENSDFGIDIEVNGIEGIRSELAAGRSVAQSISEAVGSEAAFAEAEARIRLAKQLIDGRLIDLLAQGDARQAIQAAISAQDLLSDANEGLGAVQRLYVKKIADEYGVDAESILADLGKIRQLQANVNAAADKFNAQSSSRQLGERIFGGDALGDFNDAETALQAATDNLGAFRAGLLATVEEQLGEFGATAQEVGEILTSAEQRESEVITILLARLSEGNSQLAAAYNEFQFELTTILQQNTQASDDLLADLQSTASAAAASGELSVGQSEAIAKALASGNLIEVLTQIIALKDAGDREIAGLIAREGVIAGNIDFERFGEVLVAAERETIKKVFGSLASGTLALQSDLQKSRIDALNSQAKLSKDVAEAVNLVTQAGVIELERDLTAVTKKITTEYDKVFALLPENILTGTTDAFNKAFEDATGTTLDLNQLAPTAAAIFNGSYLTDAILSQVDQNSSLEEINAIAEIESAKVRAIFLNYAAVLKKGALDEDEIADLDEFFATTFELLNRSLERSVLSVTEARDTETNRNRSKRGGKGSDIPDAVKDARDIEDAYDKAAKAARDAKRSFFDATTGIQIGDGIQQLLALDVTDIIADYDDQIRKLQRVVEDIGFNPDIGGAEKAALQAQYTETIALIEQTKQAEIDAADSFEAQMERRSVAIDKYISDLRNVSAEQENAFGQLSNGILAGFAEFNREIVTGFDIAKEATTDFLDSISSNLADVIYEGEDLFEAFGRTILDISRKVFEGFTDILVQQTISAITKDGGGLFENLLSGIPSLSANAGGGAADAAEGVAGAAGGAGVTASITAVTTALTAGGAQITGAFAAAGAPITTGGTTAGTAIGTAGTGIGTVLTTAGTGLGTGFTAIVTALGGAAAAITAATAAISAGGAGGGITSLLGALGGAAPGAAKGGYLAGNEFIRGYAPGGQVSGPGGPTTDSILALLSNKEYVVNAKATEDFFPLIDAINNGASPEALLKLMLGKSSGALPGFSEGGLVGDSIRSFEPLGRLTPSLGRGDSTVSNNNSVTLAPVYQITLGAGAGAKEADTFRKSSAQHAKDLSRLLALAKKNS